MTDKDQENRSAPSQSAPALTTESVSADEIRSMVEEAIDKKLKPVMKSLADMRQSGPSLTDILGGIGYIFGLIGVAAYISSKHRKS
jgi:nickel transport protein